PSPSRPADRPPMPPHGPAGGGETSATMSEPTEQAVTDNPPVSQEPDRRLRQLWRQGQRPDVDAFLAQAGPLSPRELAVVLRVDQRERWQAGEGVLVEAYLQRYSTLLGHAETLVDLLYNEFLLRQRHGDQPTLAEYRQRFPEH